MTATAAGMVVATCVVSAVVVWAAVRTAPEAREDKGGFHEEASPETTGGEAAEERKSA
jgi:hypothetical protein